PAAAGAGLVPARPVREKKAGACCPIGARGGECSHEAGGEARPETPNREGAMSKLDRNLRMARRCIDSVHRLHIKSTDVPFRRGAFTRRSRYHNFVLSVTRCETVGVPVEVRERRRQVLALLADITLSKRRKRAEVKALMRQWGEKCFKQYTRND